MSGITRKPDTMLETHDRLRGEGFDLVARRLVESRAYFTQWLSGRGRTNSFSSATVSVINTATNTVIATVPAVSTPLAWR
jgi:YVTN family beta-propeller protein